MPQLASLASQDALHALPLLLTLALPAAMDISSPLPTLASRNAPLASSERKNQSYALVAALLARPAMAITEGVIIVFLALLAIISIHILVQSPVQSDFTGIKESV